jgi:hypothetical protein
MGSTGTFLAAGGAPAAAAGARAAAAGATDAATGAVTAGAAAVAVAVGGRGGGEGKRVSWIVPGLAGQKPCLVSR